MNDISILIADDDTSVRVQLRAFFEEYYCEVYTAASRQEVFAYLNEYTINVLVLDYIFPESDGLTILEEVKKLHPQVEVIFITGEGNNSTVVQAMELGAFDFFHKPINGIELKNTIQRTTKYLEITERKNALTKSLTLLLQDLEKDIGKIVAESSKMKQVLKLAAKAAEHDFASVLIQGPTGSGKELVAKLVHFHSNRRSNIFYPVNCSAIAEPLMESELFGYAKGAFTGADREKPGIFEYADGGTVFLDEIGDMPLELQAKLLRVLENGTLRQIGSRQTIRVNIRIVAASNRDLAEMVEGGEFRQDLYHRINTLHLFIPPLSERREDIPPLIDYFLETLAFTTKTHTKRLSAEARNRLQKYDYPGNIRELRNIIERGIIISESDIIGVDDLYIPGNGSDSASNTENHIGHSLFQTHSQLHGKLNFSILDHIEKEILTTALNRSNNNRTRAAELTGVSRQAFTRKLKKHKML